MCVCVYLGGGGGGEREERERERARELDPQNFTLQGLYLRLSKRVYQLVLAKLPMSKKNKKSRASFLHI